MMRTTFGAAAVAAVVIAAGPEAVARQGGTGFQQAFGIAQAQVPGGQLLFARKEGNKWGFYFFVNGVVREVEVSTDGDVVKDKDAGDEKDKKEVSPDVIKLIEKQAKGRVKLPEGRLMEIAAGALKDTPFSELKYAEEGGRLVIKLGSGSVIDAETGKVTPAKK